MALLVHVSSARSQLRDLELLAAEPHMTPHEVQPFQSMDLSKLKTGHRSEHLWMLASIKFGNSGGVLVPHQGGIAKNSNAGRWDLSSVHLPDPPAMLPKLTSFIQSG